MGAFLPLASIAGNIISGILQRRALGKAAEKNKKEVENAYTKSLDLYKTSGADQSALYKWMLGSNIDAIKNAGAQGRADLIAGMKGAQGLLAPYSRMGQDSLGQTNFLLTGAPPPSHEGGAYAPPPEFPTLPTPAPSVPATPPPTHMAKGGSTDDVEMGRVDSIPAMLAKGEFVFPADAVRHFGTSKLQQMVAKAHEEIGQHNALKGEGLPSFAAGGAVDFDPNQTYDPYVTRNNAGMEARMQYEAMRKQGWDQAGFNANPHSPEAQAYAAESNKGIQQVLSGINPQGFNYTPVTDRRTGQPVVANSATASAPQVGGPQDFNKQIAAAKPVNALTAPAAGGYKSAAPPAQLTQVPKPAPTQPVLQPAPGPQPSFLHPELNNNALVGPSNKGLYTSQPQFLAAGGPVDPLANNGVVMPPVATATPAAPAVVPPDTGPGAGRGYPSNWNVNNSPNFSGDNALIARAPAPLPPGFNVGEGSTDRAVNQKVYGTNYLPGNLPGFANVKTQADFAKLSPAQQGAYRAALYQQHSTAPGAGGASYEASPLYQWQLQQGEKGINRALAARGRYDSQFGLNTLSNFYRASAAEEADKQYNREWARTVLGAQMANNQSNQLAQFTNAIANGSYKSADQLTDAFTKFAQMQGQNIDASAVNRAKNEWMRTAGITDANNMSAGAQASMWQYLGQMFSNVPGAYNALKGSAPTGIPTATPIGNNFGVPGTSTPGYPSYNALS